MFTGIVEKKASILNFERGADSVLLLVSTGYSDLSIGESVAVNGVCLTVTELGRSGEALFFVSPETIARSNLGALQTGSTVNLERALQASARLSGHIVQGHVDGIGAFLRAQQDEKSYQTWFEIPASLKRYCVEKGSICINGVSLTINELRDGPASKGSSEISITIIPHTWEHTNLGSLPPSAPVNIEVDVLAKYVERLLACQQK
jgi:riboflavin synthase